jgi:threonine dehydrogenase-like Zn-dependent dehydrogenase
VAATEQSQFVPVGEEIPSTCIAAVLTATTEPLELIPVQVPKQIEPGAMLVKTELATICGSDVHIWKGAFSAEALKLPVILGHEMVGRVVAFGRGAEHDSVDTPLQLGDRVIWEAESCGSCYACTVLRQPQLCEKRRLLSLLGCTEYPYLTGTFSEYCYVLPNAGRVRVPDNVESEWASAASCALRTVMHAFDRLGRVGHWETLVIQGAGPLGLFAAAVAKRAGAAKVIVVGGPEERLSLARSWGADETVTVESSDPAARAEAIRELTAGAGADIVMELSGAPGAFSEGLDFLRVGGRYVVVGQVGAARDPVLTAAITRKDATILGSWSATIGHYWQALEFLRLTCDQIDYRQLISGRYRLSDVNTALERMASFQEIKPALYPGEFLPDQAASATGQAS